MSVDMRMTQCYHRPDYPDWWKLSFPRSSVVPLMEEFVGDQPLFDECPTFDSGQGGVKIKRYGPVVSSHFHKQVRSNIVPFTFKTNIMPFALRNYYNAVYT